MSEIREGYKMTELGEIPREWEVNTLSYLANNRSEKFNPLTNESQRYLALEHINSVVGTINGWSDSKESTSIKSSFYKEDTLFGKLRPYLRKYWYAEFDGVCATEILALAVTDKCDSKFLFYSMQQDKVIDFTIHHSFGTKMPRTSWNELKDVEIPVPPKQEQQKIALILSTVDEQIYETEQLIVKTKELTKGLMEQLLTKGIGHTEFKQTELGEIAVGWNIETLGSVCSKIQDGNYGAKYPKSDEMLVEGIPFLTSKVLGKYGGIQIDLINFISEEKHKELKKAHLALNDVLLTNRGASVGAIAYVTKEIAHGNIGPQLTLLRSDSEIISSKFLYQLMKSSIIQSQMQGQDSGSAMKFFGIEETKKFKVVLPKIEEQQRIAQILSTVDEQIEFYEQEKAKYEELKKGLMQQLLTGQIRVKI